MKINNRYILRLNRLVKFLWIIILLGACQNEDRYGIQQDGPVLVKLSVSATDAGTASGNGTGTDAQITSIYILQFNADGDSYGALRYVAEGKRIPVEPIPLPCCRVRTAMITTSLLFLPISLTMAFCTDCTARATRKYNKPA